MNTLGAQWHGSIFIFTIYLSEDDSFAPKTSLSLSIEDDFKNYYGNCLVVGKFGYFTNFT